MVVKIQYPGIAEAVDSDLRNLDSLIKALSVVIPKVDVEQSLGDIATRVREECDYGAELANHQFFFDAWRDHPAVVIRAAPELCESADHRVRRRSGLGRDGER